MADAGVEGVSKAGDPGLDATTTALSLPRQICEVKVAVLDFHARKESSPVEEQSSNI